MADPQPESEPEPKPEAEAEQDSEPELEAEPEPEAKPEQELKQELEAKPESEPEPDPEPEAEQKQEPEPKLEAKPKMDPEPEAEPEQESEPELEAEPDSNPELEPEPESKSEPDPQLESESEPDPQPETEPGWDSDLAAALMSTTFRYEMSTETRFFLCCICGNHVVSMENCVAGVEGTDVNGIICHNPINVESDDMSHSKTVLYQRAVNVYCSGCNQHIGERFTELTAPYPRIMEGSYLLNRYLMLYWDGTQLCLAIEAFDDRPP